MNKSQNTLKKYYSTKRRRNSNSPEEDPKSFKTPCVESTSSSAFEEKMAQSNIPEWACELMAVVKSINNNMATKEDLNALNSKIDLALATTSRLDEEITSLKQENKDLKEKLIKLENNANKTNLIFRGLPKSNNYVSDIKDICSAVLGLNDVLVVQAYPIGPVNENQLVKAEFGSYAEVLAIFSKLSKLKGTGIVVHPDYVFQTRAKRAKLLAIRKEIKNKVPDIKINLNADILVVTGQDGKKVKFSWSAEKNSLESEGKDGLPLLKTITGCDLLTPISEDSDTKSNEEHKKKAFKEVDDSLAAKRGAAKALKFSKPSASQPS